MYPWVCVESLRTFKLQAAPQVLSIFYLFVDLDGGEKAGSSKFEDVL